MPARKTETVESICRFCGTAGKLKGGKVPYEQAVGELLFRTELPAVVCTECREPLITSEVLGRFELAAAHALSEMPQLVGAPAFRFMRKALGFRSQDLAELLDVTPETLSRWEHGKLPIDRKAIAILGTLVEDAHAGRATTVKRLRAMAAPTKARKSKRRVDLEVA